jgi:hypothetical protein
MTLRQLPNRQRLAPPIPPDLPEQSTRDRILTDLSAENRQTI